MTKRAKKSQIKGIKSSFTVLKTSTQASLKVRENHLLTIHEAGCYSMLELVGYSIGQNDENKRAIERNR